MRLHSTDSCLTSWTQQDALRWAMGLPCCCSVGLESMEVTMVLSLSNNGHLFGSGSLDVFLPHLPRLSLLQSPSIFSQLSSSMVIIWDALFFLLHGRRGVEFLSLWHAFVNTGKLLSESWTKQFVFPPTLSEHPSHSTCWTLRTFDNFHLYNSASMSSHTNDSSWS